MPHGAQPVVDNTYIYMIGYQAKGTPTLQVTEWQPYEHCGIAPEMITTELKTVTSVGLDRDLEP